MHPHMNTCNKLFLMQLCTPCVLKMGIQFMSESMVLWLTFGLLKVIFNTSQNSCILIITTYAPNVHFPMFPFKNMDNLKCVHGSL
jgi:hypothetical protein